MSIQAATYWSGETLAQRLGQLIEPFDAQRIDCAAYTLSIGEEIYVSPSEATADKDKVTITKLARDESFTIPPGQFAFLLTEEVVQVPSDAIAFISIRAKCKFRGLVNVSGFHVDPGYRGQLTFSVFNAGPTTIHLKRGQSVFLIWYASLDCETAYKKDGSIQRGLNPELINSISGELQSFASITSKIKNLDDKLSGRLNSIEKEQSYVRVIGAIALVIVTGTILAMGGWFIKNVLLAPTPTQVAKTAPPPSINSAPPTGALGNQVNQIQSNGTTTPATGAPPPTPQTPPQDTSKN